AACRPSALWKMACAWPAPTPAATVGQEPTDPPTRTPIHATVAIGLGAARPVQPVLGRQYRARPRGRRRGAADCAGLLALDRRFLHRLRLRLAAPQARRANP